MTTDNLARARRTQISAILPISLHKRLKKRAIDERMSVSALLEKV